MTDYCTILLNPATKSDILSACIQADAAIRVGHEQAAATSFAGWLTLIASVGALVAGVLAYFAAVTGIRQAERRERLGIKAYRHQLMVQLKFVQLEVTETFEKLKNNPKVTIDHHEALLRLPKTTAMQERLSLASSDEFVRVGDLATSLSTIANQLFELLDTYRMLVVGMADAATKTKQATDTFVEALLSNLKDLTGYANVSIGLLISEIIDQEDSNRQRFLALWKRRLGSWRGRLHP